MNAPVLPQSAASEGLDMVDFLLDGQAVQARPGETIWQVAQRQGVEIPHLCHREGLRPDGNCRACVVEIAGERTLSPSCCRQPTPGMQVQAQSARARQSQKMVVEMLLSDLPEQGYRWNDAGPAQAYARGNAPDLIASGVDPESPAGLLEASSPPAAAGAGPHGELSAWAQRLGVSVRPALQALRREPPAPDLSHPAIAVNLDACIQCNRCVRACREEQVNGVIGVAGRGAHSRIVFDLGDPMQDSSCVACGECVQACPTGALSAKTLIGSQRVDRQVDSVCPFCGVGCQITYQVRGEKIVRVDGREGPANQGRLCVKGRFGFDYVHH
ncbi:MAG: 2Fe-2S iron-sulfur cluster-binding protein, partial [Burkholderiaceae bacterium]|nr:2Fe-2S iron-sulfur cluster-binding protein [Burkholderiaceae bacterium]